ncbi:hypothetical protein KP003_02920 [Geomonas nitrogeniifigens]|uniref:hypothetical protein n=1 Tax=Geomonas diazotrophica TaxID=2843197 RepID=UPI001C2C7F1C|nr:hypothetical protein [Geomonas nitrogeniifigens]QXE87377.1 hypothetical protein KP003_02920 [Geomonas nitrogeniifigens]
MTRYTDFNGSNILLCDHCRADMPQGSPAFSLAPGTVGDGYLARDYNKGEIILCPNCSSIVSEIISLLVNKRTDKVTIVQEVA